jgi:protein required for attachment to host cells
MPKHKPIWIVIADSSRAQILTRRPEARGFDLVTAFQSADAHASAHMLGGDKPGRGQESASSAHHAIEPRIDAHEASQVKFLRTVAQYLNENAKDGAVGGLVLCAPPRALGHLRKLLDRSVAQKIRSEVPKDLTQVPIAELPKHLGGLG